jgi:hypothetical protein
VFLADQAHVSPSETGEALAHHPQPRRAIPKISRFVAPPGGAGQAGTEVSRDCHPRHS